MPKVSLKNLSLKKILPWLQQHLAIFVNIIMIVLLLYIAYFVYSTVYAVAINPDPVDETEIFASRQKVDTENFTEALDEIEARQNPFAQTDITGIYNPFQ